MRGVSRCTGDRIRRSSLRSSLTVWRMELAQMRTFTLVGLFLAMPMTSVLAQTPQLQTNVVYVCKDGQSFKIFSCDNTTGACDYQNYKNGQAYQRGEALRVQLAVLLPAKC